MNRRHLICVLGVIAIASAIASKWTFQTFNIPEVSQLRVGMRISEVQVICDAQRLQLESRDSRRFRLKNKNVDLLFDDRQKLASITDYTDPLSLGGKDVIRPGDNMDTVVQALGEPDSSIVAPWDREEIYMEYRRYNVAVVMGRTKAVRYIFLH